MDFSPPVKLYFSSIFLFSPSQPPPPPTPHHPRSSDLTPKIWPKSGHADHVLKTPLYSLSAKIRSQGLVRGYPGDLSFSLFFTVSLGFLLIFLRFRPWRS